MDSESFIVQVSWKIFFTYLREGTIFETPYPSAATHMTYDVADAVCQKIRARGHKDSVVCDFLGNPVVATDIAKIQPISENKLRQFYDDCVTELDWKIFRGIAANEDPRALATRLGIKHGDIQQAIEDANRRIDEECVRLHKDNDDAQHLANVKKADHEAMLDVSKNSKIL
jgi:hypothetical protein